MCMNEATMNEANDQPHHILHVLQHKVATMPHHLLLTMVDKACKEVQTLTYQQIEEASNVVAALLLQKGCRKGDHVMVAYPIGLNFLAGMLGCMKIGVVPCSIYPPNPKNLRSELAKFKRFVQDAGAKYAISTTAFCNIMSAAGIIYDSGGVSWLGTDKLSHKRYRLFNGDRINPDKEDISFIQYTSGSTGHPKGVMISHRALLNNCIEIAAIGEADPSNTGVMWVPQYHDMGLVGGFMTTLYSGVHLVVASPLDFIMKPLLWADMIERYKADFTCAPNFAFALLLKRLDKVGRTVSWSHVKRAIFGGEPTRMDVVNQLVTDTQIRPENVWNMYGMAEVGLCVTAGVARCGEDDDLATCGLTESDYATIRIVKDGTTAPVADGQVGSIFVWSSLAASGYHGQAELTRSTFRNRLDGEIGSRWLNTGDLGKIMNGELFVTGRVKDVIIVNGKNYYPTDIENAVDSKLGNMIRPGRTAVVQFDDTSVAVTVEVRSNKAVDDHLCGSIMSTVSVESGLSVGRVYVFKSGVIPKTTSGKLKRNEIRQTCLAEGWKQTDILASYHADDQTSPIRFPLDEASIEQVGGGKPSVEATISSLLGPNMDMNKSWEANGLTSLKHAELISSVQELHQVSAPFNFHETHPTPSHLMRFIESSASQLFPVNLPDLEGSQRKGDLRGSLSTPVLTFLQTIGIALIFLIFAACLVPSYFVGKLTVPLWSSFAVGASQRLVVWSWLPVVVPTFFLTFSLVVVLLKWAVVGRYRSAVVDSTSVSFLRWWFIDRLMEVWEIFVGTFIVETKLIWLMYRLMGARLAFSCQVDAFIREFDLVRVGSNTSIAHQIRCRKFSLTAVGEPSITFRPISVGKGCILKGMLQPGVRLGNSSRVEKLAAVAEGSQVPSSTSVTGSPAYSNGPYEAKHANSLNWLVLDSLKIAWLFVELYIFFALFLLAQMVLNEQLPRDWRYTPLLYWILVISLTSGFGVVASILLKWLLIGRRRPKKNNKPSSWRQFCFWVCDFHFRLVVGNLLPITGVSRLWNVVLMLHGLDIDLATFYPNIVTNFRPSTVDLIRVRRSFLSSFSFEAGEYVEIIDSSIGYHAYIKSGVKIHRSNIPPRTIVQESTYDASFIVNPELPGSNWVNVMLRELSFPPCALFVMSSFIPAYELFVATMYDATPALAILWLCVILLVQCLTWTCTDRVVQAILQLSRSRAQSIIYPAYLIVTSYNQVWNILQLSLLGTPFVRILLRFMGSRVEGDLWYFSSETYDFHKLTFQDKTLIDNAHVAGHYMIFDELTLKETVVGGVVHPGTYCPAGANLQQGSESGPWKAYLGSAGNKQDTEKFLEEDTELAANNYDDSGSEIELSFHA